MSKREKYKALSKNTVLFTVSSFGSKFVTLLLIPLYTTLLNTSDYGDVDVVTTTAMLLIPLLTLDIQDAVLRYSLDETFSKADILSAGLKIIAIGMAFLIISIFVIEILNLAFWDFKYMLYLLVLFLTGSLSNTLNMYLRAKDAVRLIMIGGILGTFSTGILNVFFLVIVHMGIDGYLIGNALGNMVCVFYFVWAGRVWRDLRLRQPKGLFRSMLLYSAPLVVNSMAWWVTSASNRYAVMAFCGAAATGVFAVAYKIPTILSTIQGVFYNAWSISAIKEFDREDNDGFIGETYSLYSCATHIACSGIMLLNIPLASILYANDYFEAWQYVPPLLVGTAFNGLALFEGCIFSAVRMTKEVAVTTLWGSAVCLVGNIVLVAIWGPLGAAVSACVGYMLVWVLRTMRLKKIVSMKVNWHRQMWCTVALLAQCVLATLNVHLALQVILMLSLCVLQRKYLSTVLQVIARKLRAKCCRS